MEVIIFDQRQVSEDKQSHVLTVPAVTEWKSWIGQKCEDLK